MSLQSKENKSKIINLNLNLNQIILGLLILFLVLIFLSVFVFFYLAFYQEIIEAYLISSYAYYLTMITIVVLIRILISMYLSYFFLKRWFSQENQALSDLSFLFAFLFYLMIIHKLLDLLMYTSFAGNDFFPNLSVLTLFKIKLIIATISAIPLFLIGIYFYFIHLNLNKINRNKEKMVKTIASLISAIIAIFSIILILVGQTMIFLSFLFIGLGFTFVFLSWLFFKAHQGKILKEINCLIISIGFLFYFACHIISPSFSSLLSNIPIHGMGISVLVGEIVALISFILLLIGFKTKAEYE